MVCTFQLGTMGCVGERGSHSDIQFQRGTSNMPVLVLEGVSMGGRDSQVTAKHQH
jgi:hypothetical protein